MRLARQVTFARALRFAPLLLLALLALVTGLWAGLVRLGWSLPFGGVAGQHGPLMVSGFLGTLIALERVAALGRPWMFLAPLCSGLGWIAGLLLPSTPVGPLLILLGSAVLVAILLVMVRREAHLHVLVMAAGGLAWLSGNLLWLAGLPIFTLVFFWAAFLVLTIAGERLELSRVLRPTRRQQALFLAASGLFAAGVVLAAWQLDSGTRLAGLGMIAMAAWLARFDLARRNLRHRAPLTRYIAVCLFTGYLWLGASGAIALAAGGQVAGALYDALLHTLFVGFVFSMIFGHAPIILPALTGLLVGFRPALYAPLVLLHGSLVLRIAGDLAGWRAGRMWGGLLNEVAIVMFVGMMAWVVISARKRAG